MALTASGDAAYLRVVVRVYAPVLGGEASRWLKSRAGLPRHRIGDLCRDAPSVDWGDGGHVIQVKYRGVQFKTTR